VVGGGLPGSIVGLLDQLLLVLGATAGAERH
jgi:hypothetical protein